MKEGVGVVIKDILFYAMIGVIATSCFMYFKFKDNIKTPPVDMPQIEERTNDINGMRKTDKSKKMKLEDYYVEL